MTASTHQKVDLDVQVLVGGVWYDGVLAEWRRDPDGAWTGWVRWHEAPGVNRIEVFPADHIRAV